jgi:hypothetical protein
MIRVGDVIVSKSRKTMVRVISVDNNLLEYEYIMSTQPNKKGEICKIHIEPVIYSLEDGSYSIDESHRVSQILKLYK